MAWYVWVPIIAAARRARRGDEGVGDVSRRGRRLLMGRVGLFARWRRQSQPKRDGWNTGVIFAAGFRAGIREAQTTVGADEAFRAWVEGRPNGYPHYAEKVPYDPVLDPPRL